MELTIIIADDHPLFRGALRQAVCGLEPTPAIVEADDLDSARRAVAEHSDADILLLDLAMPGMNGLTGLISLRSEYPGLPVVIVSANEDQATIRRVFELGVAGFIPKSSGIEDIRAALTKVLEGGVAEPEDFVAGRDHDPEIEDLLQRLQTLTPQQTRVLGMLCEGLLNKQIAYELGVSEATIKAHVSAILLKLNVDSRTQAVIQLSKITQLQSA
ncbi:response regulator [Rhizobium sp. L1K21]|uniref:response regulator transcription factor n=1 Tax=Rhizobium sp. L1K21 TaxID=2954933 RepID=UPI0020935A6E|nr:response regulator transcription factor [Rhizobium sp. L1K21]